MIQKTREFDHGGRRYRVRDNNCYWELAVLEADETWRHLWVDEDIEESLIVAYDAACKEADALAETSEFIPDPTRIYYSCDDGHNEPYTAGPADLDTLRAVIRHYFGDDEVEERLRELGEEGVTGDGSDTIRIEGADDIEARGRAMIVDAEKMRRGEKLP